MAKMIRSVCVVFVFMLSTISLAQNQQGYVKTKGRLASNGTVKAGVRLSGVTVQVKGRTAILSQSNGTFSFPIPAQNYYLQNVQKQGFVMTDPDMLSRQYAYSKNPLVLVLETKEQQADDKLAAEKKIRKTLQRQLQEKEDEIESLKEQQKLSEEEYRKQLQEMYAQQESNEKLISEMADRYSRMDFDEVDEFNRRISQLILDGKLMEADSLLNTKGDINARVAVLRQHQEANAQAEQEIKKKQKKLEKSKELTQKELEDLAQDCYSKFEIFKMKHQNDSAASYLEMRVNLDTMNIDWNIDYAHFEAYYHSRYANAIRIYKNALGHAVNQYGAENSKVAIIYGELSEVYRYQDNSNDAIDYGIKALELNRKLFGGQHPLVAVDYNTLGVAYASKGELHKGLEYLRLSMAIKKDLFGDNHIELAKVYNNIANIYSNLSQFDDALKYATKSLELNIAYYGDKSRSVVLNYAELANLSITAGRLDEGLEYCFKGIDILKENKLEHHIMYATLCGMISHGYSFKGDFEKGLDYANLSLVKFLEIVGEIHSSVAMTYQDIGYIYSYLDNNEKSLEYNLKALNILKSLGAHDNVLAQSYNNVGYLSYLMGKYKEALDYHQQALELRVHTIGERSVDVAQSYDNIGMALFGLKNYQNAMEYHKKALDIRKEVQGDTHHELAWSYIGMGDVYAATEMYDKAVECYEKAYQLRKNGLGDKHPDTILCLSKKEDVISAMKKQKENKRKGK